MPWPREVALPRLPSLSLSPVATARGSWALCGCAVSALHGTQESGGLWVLSVALQRSCTKPCSCVVVTVMGMASLGALQKSPLLLWDAAVRAPGVGIRQGEGLGVAEALQRFVEGQSGFQVSDPVLFSALPVAQKVVALRKKQQLSIGPCKSLPNSPSHSSVSAASIPSVHINQVGNRNRGRQEPHVLLPTPPSLHSTDRSASLCTHTTALE